jgi:hypothetical protein
MGEGKGRGGSHHGVQLAMTFEAVARGTVRHDVSSVSLGLLCRPAESEGKV